MADNLHNLRSDRVELLLDKRARTVQTIRIESSVNLATWTTVLSVPAKDQPPGGGYKDTYYRGKVYVRFDPADYSLTYPFHLRFVDVSSGVDTSTSSSMTIPDPAETAGDVAAGLQPELYLR